MLKKIFLSIALCISVQAHAAELWRVTSLEWPPFSGRDLPQGGAGIAVLRAALLAEGIQLAVEYYPWTRAINTARGSAYAGVYPAWPEDVRPGFVGSSVLFKSPVGFVEPRSRPLVWKRLEDLAGKKIGIVQDYGNTLEFMRLVKSNTFKAEVVVDDLTNVRKVAAGRIDAAFIDLNNLSYFLKHDAKDIADRVQANARAIGTKDLLMAINVNFPNKDAHAVLARGLAKINAEHIIRQYMESNFP